MSDLAATNCGCGDERCGCNNNCGCGNGNSLFGDNSCNCILWIICLMCLCGNNGVETDAAAAMAMIPAGSLSYCSCSVVDVAITVVAA